MLLPGREQVKGQNNCWRKEQNMSDATTLSFASAEVAPFRFLWIRLVSPSFTRGEIAPTKYYCDTCKEPISRSVEQRSWCQIDDNLRYQAASRNQFRLLESRGLLRNYIADMDAISGKRKR